MPNTTHCSSETVVHLFPNGMVERFTRPRFGRLGYYRWVPAYSEARALNLESMPLSRSQWFDAGALHSFRCRFHGSKEEARQAMQKSLQKSLRFA